MQHTFMTLEVNAKVLAESLSVLEAPGRIYPLILELLEDITLSSYRTQALP